jgi:hypothetical protein
VLLYAKGIAAVPDNRYFHAFTALNALINKAAVWVGALPSGPAWNLASHPIAVGVEYITFSEPRDPELHRRPS